MVVSGVGAVSDEWGTPVGSRVEDVGSRVLEKGRAGRNGVDWAAKNQGLMGFGLRV